jgi:hypothetical protein
MSRELPSVFFFYGLFMHYCCCNLLHKFSSSSSSSSFAADWFRLLENEKDYMSEYIHTCVRACMNLQTPRASFPTGGVYCGVPPRAAGEKGDKNMGQTHTHTHTQTNKHTHTHTHTLSHTHTNTHTGSIGRLETSWSDCCHTCCTRTCAHFSWCAARCVSTSSASRWRIWNTEYEMHM